MDVLLKIVSFALVAACMCVVLRGQTGTLAMLLSLAACVCILLLSLSFFAPILTVVQTLRDMTGLSDAVTAPMLKVAGIGIVSQAASAVCEDAGEKALGKAVEIGSSILSVYVALPLLSAVLNLLKETLGG